jgi:hypothetical protein
LKFPQGNTIHLQILHRQNNMDIENAKAQMRKGVLELCILAIIEEDEVYPSDIIARLKSQRPDRGGGYAVSTPHAPQK